MWAFASGNLRMGPLDGRDPGEGTVLLVGALVTVLIAKEAFRRLRASPVAVRARSAVTIPGRMSAGDTVIALAVLKDALHQVGVRVLRPPVHGG
jgi:hypothetical protein